MPTRIHDIDVTVDADAQRLADMFNDFDSAWPGGFNRGNPDTVSTVRERMLRSRRSAVLAVECDGAFVGYCDLKPFPGDPDMVYVDLLGARLSHHGKGVGKMLLLEMVRRASDMGARQVTLHTWAGNMKAVPLYKRTGFQWKPDTDVYMQNFIPAILASPAGRRFFDGADWYACHERETELQADDTRWHGMEVYAYRFRRGEDFLNVWIDRASERITAIETPRYLVGCCVPVEEAAAGETCPIEWTVAWRGPEPVDAAISCECDKGISVELDERRSVDGEATLTRELRIDSSARFHREGDEPHRVRTTIRLGDETIALETGVKVVEPVEIAFGGQGLRLGRRERLTVRLRNRLNRDLHGGIGLPAHPALVCEPVCAPFDLPARSWVDCEIAVTGSAPGVHSSVLALRAEGVRVERPVAFRVFACGETLASVDADHDETAMLETPSLRVTAGLRGGWLNLADGLTGKDLLSIGEAELGPPFGAWRLKPRVWQGRIEEGPGGSCLVVSRMADEIDGLEIERRITMAGGDAVRVEHRVANHGAEPRDVSLLIAPEAKLSGHVACPTPLGLVRETMHGWGHFPTAPYDLIPEHGSLAEAWCAVEEDGAVCGHAWAGSPEQKVGWDSPLPSLTYALGDVPAHGHVDAPEVLLVGGPGTWRAVRDWWRRAIAPSDPVPETPPEPRCAVELRSDPSPALLSSEGSSVAMSLTSMRRQSGLAEVTLTCVGAQVTPSEGPSAHVHRDQPVAFEAKVEGPSGTFAAMVSADVRVDGLARQFDVPVLRLAGSGSVDVSEPGEGLIVVDNGRSRFVAAPGFGGSVISLVVDGIERLRTAHPEARPFVWANPWYGGIHASMDWIGGLKLARESYTGSLVERVGVHGTVWRGVRVDCEPRHKDRAWFRLEVDYLTAPCSPVLAVVSRWINRSGARMKFGDVPVIAAWLAPWPSNAPDIHWVKGGVRWQQRSGRLAADMRSDSWGAVSDRGSGRALLMVSSARESRTQIEDLAENGQHLGVALPMTLEPNEAREAITWVVACTVDELDAYAALAKVTALP